MEPCFRSQKNIENPPYFHLLSKPGNRWNYYDRNRKPRSWSLRNKQILKWWFHKLLRSKPRNVLLINGRISTANRKAIFRSIKRRYHKNECRYSKQDYNLEQKWCKYFNFKNLR